MAVVRSLRPILALPVLLALLLSAPPGAAAAENPALQPPFGDQPLAPLTRWTTSDRAPPGFQLTGAEAIAIADGAANVRDERAESPAMQPRVSTRGDDRWQIDYYEGGTDVAQAVVDDRTGTVVEAWRNQQVEVKLARGYEDAVAGNVSEAWIWIPLCILFVLPFFDPRRPFRLLHLDLLVLLSFSVSQFFFNKGEIVWSVPLVYPVLGYLFVRMLVAGFRPRERSGPLIPVIPVRWLAIAAIVLAVFRIGMNVVDSQVIDIGFANVVGADRIADGEGVYDGQLHPADRPRRLLRAVRLHLLRPVRAAAARGTAASRACPPPTLAAIVFDLGVVGCCCSRAGDCAPGVEGRELGIALAFAWLAYPYTLYALDANGGNDALVAALLVAALIAFASPLKPRARDRARGRDEVRSPGAGAAVRRRLGRAADPLDADLRGRLRRRLGGGAAAAASRRRLPRVLRPDVRLPGVAWLAVQRLGPRAVARLASRTSPRASRSCSGSSLFFLPRATHGAAGGGARRRRADRDPGRLDALVLLLHPLVDALRPHQRLRHAGADLGSRPGAGCRYRASPVRRYLDRGGTRAPLRRSRRPR